MEKERARHTRRSPLWYGLLAATNVTPGRPGAPVESNGASSLVSQFTLLAQTKKGSKPDFHGAMGGEEAKRLYQYFVQKVKDGYESERVKDGVFQAMMEVALVNDGPVSLPLRRLSARTKTYGTKVTLEVSASPKPPVGKPPTPRAVVTTPSDNTGSPSNA